MISLNDCLFILKLSVGVKTYLNTTGFPDYGENCLVGLKSLVDVMQYICDNW
jgi:hypothetical protein